MEQVTSFCRMKPTLTDKRDKNKRLPTGGKEPLVTPGVHPAFLARLAYKAKNKVQESASVSALGLVTSLIFKVWNVEIKTQETKRRKTFTTGCLDYTFHPDSFL